MAPECAVPRLAVTTIVDDSAGRNVPLAEHGLSFLVETPDCLLLFDTGSGLAFRANAKALRVPFGRVNALALSHGHYDHTGNLPYILEGPFQGKVFFHPEITRTRYARKDRGPVRAIGIPDQGRALAQLPPERAIADRAIIPVSDTLFLTGEVPRRTDFEDVGGHFYLDQACTCPDDLIDDQSLIAEVPDGLVVIAGCAHSGIVNVLLHVRDSWPDRPVVAVLGGIHLVNAAESHIAKTLTAFEEFGIQRVALGHCTGFQAMTAFAKLFGPRFSLLRSGSRIDF